MVAICVSASALLVVSSQDLPKTSKGGKVANVRHLANFRPCIWGDHFIQYSKNGVGCSRMQQEIQTLKAVVRKQLEAVSNNPLRHLEMIGDIKGLGLGYHFEEEIEEAMASMYEKGHGVTGGYDLYHSSLYFRLLRQHGYRVPSDIFKKFVDSNGGIKEEFNGDIKGLLGLYETAQLRLHEDAILDHVLYATIAIIESYLATAMDMGEIKKTLKLPMHKDTPRMRAWRYISTYGNRGESSHNKNLLRMAKLDFNFLQQRYQYEISQLSIWRKELGVSSKCPFARDRLVEPYLWSLEVCPEPQYGISRKIFTKLVFLLGIVDDIYDAYGTADELDLLTQAIARFDMSLAEQMPEYMRTIFQLILDVVEETERYMAPEGKSYRTHYFRKGIQMIVKAYYDEYLWLKNKQVPTIEQHMQASLPSTGVPSLILAALVGMGDEDITEESFEWVLNTPKMVTAACIIGRLKDDMVSHKFEQERAHHPSSVECYMNQYEVSEQETYIEFNKQVTSVWKDMNEACLKPAAVPFKVLERVLNICRIVERFYADGDGYTHAQEFMKDTVTALLVDPIPI